MPTYILDVKTRRLSDGQSTRTRYAVDTQYDETYVRRFAESLGHTVIGCDISHEILNRDMNAGDLVPCETNPTNGRLSTMLDTYHAEATVTVGKRIELTHACRKCAEDWHTHKTRQEGIRWATVEVSK